MRRLACAALGAVLSLVVVEKAGATTLHVLSSGGFTPAFRQLAPACGKKVGAELDLQLGASMGDTPTAIPARLRRDEPADVLLMVKSALDRLVEEGQVGKASEVELAGSRIGMAVKAGAPHPDISSVEAFKATLLHARSIAYSDSASGVYLKNELFPRLGLAEQLKDKAHMIPGDPVAGVVAKGDAELGFQQISELKPIPGAEVVGPIPDALQKVTIYAAGVPEHSKEQAAARALIACLAAPENAKVIAATGMDPIHTP